MSDYVAHLGGIEFLAGSIRMFLSKEPNDDLTMEDLKEAHLALDRLKEMATPVGDKIFVLFTMGQGDPVPFTTCVTAELAEQYARGLSLLPDGHPLRTDLDTTFIDEIPLLRSLPEPIQIALATEGEGE